MNRQQIRERLSQELVDRLNALGLDVEDVEVSAAGKRTVVRIAVDKDGGVTMDDVTDATKAVNEVLDSQDVMGEQPYTLEVGSPGVERPLTLPRHFRRNRNRLVKVKTKGGETLTGRIAEIDEDSVHLEVSGAARSVRLADVASARVQIEFNRAGE